MKINLIAGETNFEASKNALKQIDLSDMTKQNLVVVPDRFSMQAENLVFDTYLPVDCVHFCLTPFYLCA